MSSSNCRLFHLVGIDSLVHVISLKNTHTQLFPLNFIANCNCIWLFEIGAWACVYQAISKFKHWLSTFNPRSSWGETNVIGNPFVWNILSFGVATVQYNIMHACMHVYLQCSGCWFVWFLAFACRMPCTQNYMHNFHNGKLCSHCDLVRCCHQTCHCSNFGLISLALRDALTRHHSSGSGRFVSRLLWLFARNW